MYDLKKIASFIENPSLIGQEDIESLKRLSNEQTFTPIFSILYLKAVKKFQPLEFETELKKHAFKIPSREQLFNIIEENSYESTEAKPIKKPEDVTENTSPSFSEAEKPSQEEHQNKELDEKEFPTNEESDTLEESETKESFTENNQEVEKLDKEEALNTEKSDSSDDHVEINQKEEETNKPIDPLEQEILSSAVGATLHLEIEEFANEFEDKTQKKAQKEDKDVEIDFNISKNESFNQEEADLESPEVENIEEEKQEHSKQNIDYNESRSFIDWLKLGQEKQTIDEEKEKSAKKDSKKDNREKNIEKFSTEKKEEKEFFSATKKAKESLDYSKIPMTETLAKVYEAQGNFPRAIEAYEQLILKNPEKKVFFAIRIEKLKKNLNN